MKRRTLILVNVLFALSTSNALAQEARAHYNNVLGTSLDIELTGVSYARAQTNIELMLQEIKRLEEILSVWQSGSEISRLNQQKTGKNLSHELIEVIQLCESWHQKSNHAFSCRLGSIEQLWQQAQQLQQVPDRVEMRFKARDIDRQSIVIAEHTNSIQLAKSVSLDPSGLAKGYIIDKAAKWMLKQLPEASGLKLDIGGDAYYWGKAESDKNWLIAIAGPQDKTEQLDGSPRQYVKLSGKAIASSGHKSRYFEIERRRFSHILSPKDGWPMDNAPAATVIANNVTIADAVATALSTMPATQGIDWVESLPDVEAIVMLEQGVTLSSSGWTSYFFSYAKAEKETAQPRHLTVDYQIPNIKAMEYHKPYIAIWLTDSHHTPIKNLLLLGESTRWARENTRWWRRIGRKSGSLMDGIARPTRRPGHYTLSWNGLDDQGRWVSAKQLILHVEAAREDGGHDYQSLQFSFSDKDHTKSLPAKGEVGSLTVTLHSQ